MHLIRSMGTKFHNLIKVEFLYAEIRSSNRKIAEDFLIQELGR